MLNGDLSNQSAPRIYVVFDKFIGTLPEDSGEFYELMGEGKYKEALDLMIMDIKILNKINWLSVKKNINVYLVTWMGQGMSEAIENFMNDVNIPVRGCLSVSPNFLAKLVLQDDSVMGIYDPDPDHVLTYGTKGRIVKSERDLS